MTPILSRAGVEKIIAAQGYASYVNRRVYCPGNGAETTYYTVYAIEGHGKRRIRHYLGGLMALTQMSEADLVSLIQSKTATSAQGAAQKGKE